MITLLIGYGIVAFLVGAFMFGFMFEGQEKRPLLTKLMMIFLLAVICIAWPVLVMTILSLRLYDAGRNLAK